MFAFFFLLCLSCGSSLTRSIRFVATLGGGFGILNRVGYASLFNLFLLRNISSSKWSAHILRLHRDSGSLFIKSVLLQFTAHLLDLLYGFRKKVHVYIILQPICIKTFLCNSHILRLHRFWIPFY